MRLSTFMWILQVTISILLTVSKSTYGIEGYGVYRYPRYCGGYHTINDSVISSPYYPRNTYPPNVDCTWRITAPEGHMIRLTFSVFDVEYSTNCVYDYLLVEETAGNNVEKFCGNDLPPVIMSKNNVLIVKFHSDGGKAGIGFRARYHFFFNPRSCGGNLTTNNSEIISPMYPQPYPPNAECVWRIKAPERHRIRLTFSNFSLEDSFTCLYDYVLMEETEGHTIGKFCGSNVPPVITSKNNSLMLKFRSDGIENRVGFKARLQFLPNPISCGGNLTDNNSEISSPSYRRPYPLDFTCVWLIKAPEGHRIRLTFSNFSLNETSTSCLLEYVLVTEGHTTEKLCQTRKPPVITSNSDTLKVTFHSDKRVGGVRLKFKARYEFLPRPNESCGGYRTENNSGISSPSYPQPYPHNSNCTWWITAPEGHIIRLRFSNFTLEDSDTCQYDFVLVQDIGVTMKFCGSSLPSVIISKNNTLMVKFHADRSVAGDGFKARYQFLPDPKESSEVNRTFKYETTTLFEATETTEIIPHQSEAPYETAHEAPHENPATHHTDPSRKTLHEIEVPYETEIPKETEEPHETTTHQTKPLCTTEAPRETHAPLQSEIPSANDETRETEIPYERKSPQETNATHETEASVTAALHEIGVPLIHKTEIPYESESLKETNATYEAEIISGTAALHEVGVPFEAEASLETETTHGSRALNGTEISHEHESAAPSRSEKLQEYENTSPNVIETSHEYETGAPNGTETSHEHESAAPNGTETSHEHDATETPQVTETRSGTAALHEIGVLIHKTEIPYESVSLQETNATHEAEIISVTAALQEVGVPLEAETSLETETTHGSRTLNGTDISHEHENEAPNGIETSHEYENTSPNVIETSHEYETGAPNGTETSHEHESAAPNGTETSHEHDATETPQETDSSHQTETPNGIEAALESGTSNQTKVPYDTEASHGSVASNETDDIGLPTETEVPHENEVPLQTDAIIETVPDKTEIPIETEVLHESRIPKETETPDFSTSSHVAEHPNLLNETLREIVKDAGERNKTVEIILGTLLGLISLISAVGFCINRQNSRRLKHSAYLPRTEELSSYESKSPKERNMLPVY